MKCFNHKYFREDYNDYNIKYFCDDFRLQHTLIVSQKENKGGKEEHHGAITFWMEENQAAAATAPGSSLITYKVKIIGIS